MQGLTVTAVIPKAPAAGAAATGAPTTDGTSDAGATGSMVDGAFGALLAAHIKSAADLAAASPVATDPTSDDPALPAPGKPKDQTGETPVDPTQSAMALAEMSAAVSLLQQPVSSPVSTAASATPDVTAETSVASSTDAKSLLALPLAQAAKGSGPAPQLDTKALSETPLTQTQPAPTEPVSAKQIVADIAAGGKVLPSAVAATVLDTRQTTTPGTDVQRQPDAPAGALASLVNAGYVATGSEVKAASPTVSPAVGSSGWGEALGQKVVWMAGQNQQVAELHLNPPNLGPMEVRLTVNNDQVSAVFVSHQPAVREAIEAAMPRLREMFADSGMMLGNAMVSSDSLPQQQPQAQNGRSSGSSGSDAAISADGSAAVASTRGVISLSGGSGRGLVDLFA